MQPNCTAVTTLSSYYEDRSRMHRSQATEPMATYQKRFCHSWVVTACCFKSLLTVGLSSCHLSSNCTPGFLEFNSKEDIFRHLSFHFFVTDFHTFWKRTAEQCALRCRRANGKGLWKVIENGGTNVFLLSNKLRVQRIKERLYWAAVQLVVQFSISLMNQRKAASRNWLCASRVFDFFPFSDRRKIPPIPLWERTCGPQ